MTISKSSFNFAKMQLLMLPMELMEMTMVIMMHPLLSLIHPLMIRTMLLSSEELIAMNAKKICKVMWIP
jgi:hypothetical protein